MSKRKVYSRIKSARTGRAELLHRSVAANILGRSLLLGLNLAKARFLSNPDERLSSAV